MQKNHTHSHFHTPFLRSLEYISGLGRFELCTCITTFKLSWYVKLLKKVSGGEVGILRNFSWSSQKNWEFLSQLRDSVINFFFLPNRKAVNAFKRLARLDQEYYPERMGKVSQEQRQVQNTGHRSLFYQYRKYPKHS